MGEEQLKLFEKRIEKAINFIEELKSREKNFIEEKNDLEGRIKKLNDEIENKNDLIDELRHSQRFLKEKIEVILDKLETIEIFDVDEGMDTSKTIANEGELLEPVLESKIIQDDNLVDLKKIDEKEEVKGGNSSSKPILTEEVVDSSETDTLVENEGEPLKKPLDEEMAKEISSNHKDNVIDKEDTSKPEDLESGEELKVIDGGKKIFEKNTDSKFLNPEEDEKANSSVNNNENEGFLFNTGNVNEKLKNNSNWFENNPFI